MSKSKRPTSRAIATRGAIATVLAAAAVFTMAIPAHAWGTAHNGVYHGFSSQTTHAPFAYVLTHHDNINGPNYVAAQIRTSSGVAGPKVAGTGTVSYVAGTTYYGQNGGKHWGGSSTSTPFNS